MINRLRRLRAIKKAERIDWNTLSVERRVLTPVETYASHEEGHYLFYTGHHNGNGFVHYCPECDKYFALCRAVPRTDNMGGKWDAVGEVDD